MYGHRNFDQVIANINNANDSVALDAALKFLYIDKNSYANIHLLEIKKEFLLYKLLHAEYRICKQIHGAQADRLQQVAVRAYKCILDSSMTTLVKEGYSKFSFGLSEIDLSTSREESEAEEFAEIEQSVMKVGEKKGGVEPGFEAIHAKDVLLHIFKKYPDQQERIKLINSYNGDLEKLHAKFKDDLPRYMVKLDYQDTSNGKIVVNKEDLKRAKTVQEFYEKGEVVGDFLTWIYAKSKAVSPIDKNCEAVLEVAANDVARLFMNVQDQTLRQERYKKTGTLKLTLKCTWIKGAKTLAPIAGGKNNDNYCVTPVVLPADGVTAISDSSMAYLAEKLPIFIVQNDRDAIGSQGQNKLRRGNDFMAIDFGHAYQSATSLLDKLTLDFHILDADFKNYSIFYDSKRSDIIRGLIKLAVFGGMKMDERVLASYGADFLAEIKCIIPHSDEKIFDDYINKFTEMAIQIRSSGEAAHVKSENIACCKKIVEKLNEAKKKHIAARDELVSMFAFYLSSDAPAIDLLDSLEKLSTPRDKVSLRSPDGTALLNHIRISDADRAQWQIKVGYQEQHMLTGVFASDRLARLALESIKSMLPANADFVTIEQDGKMLSFVFDKIYLTSLANIFNEDKIKRKLFPDDVKLCKRFQAECSLAQLFETFKQYGAQAELKAVDNQRYALMFAAIPPNGIDAAFLFFLKKALDGLGIVYVDAGGKISFSITQDLIEVLEEKLNLLTHEMSSLKDSHASFSDINTIIQSHPNIGSNLILILHEMQGGLSLELISGDPKSKDAERCLQSFIMTLRKEFKIGDDGRIAVPYERLVVLNRVLQGGIGRYELVLKLLNSARSVRSQSVFPAASSTDQVSEKVDAPANRKK